jgi:hypothetical protein
LAGYPINPKAGYRISGEAGYRISGWIKDIKWPDIEPAGLLVRISGWPDYFAGYPVHL